MAKNTDKNEEVVQAIRYTWDSLESHLPYIVDKDKAHHKKAMLEYAFIIKVLLEKL